MSSSSLEEMTTRWLVGAAMNMTTSSNTTMGSSRSIVAPPETTFEFISNIILGLAYLGLTLVSAQRMSWSRQQGGAETTVVTAFYALILVTSSLRTVYFLVPTQVWQPSYTPTAVMAFSKTHKSWVGLFFSELIMTAGSLCLFAIFILILVYWADILKKYFYPGARRSRPMIIFFGLVALLVGLEFLNAFLFLLRAYSSEGMVLYNAVLLAVVSIVCVTQITIFSHRFRTVLKTLGAINQVSTESQVKRIVWITVTGNLFFFARAFLETLFAVIVLVYWHRNGTVAYVFSPTLWNAYVLMKYWSEIAILTLMLYILQSRFATNATAGSAGGGGYQSIPNAEEGAPSNPSSVIV